MPRDCMLWEAYSKATVLLYIHKYNYIYLLYLYILIFKPKQCRGKRQRCERQLPTALCLPAVEPAGMGARGCAIPRPASGAAQGSVRQGEVCSLACARPWVPAGAGVSTGSDPERGWRGGLQCVPLPSTRASVSLGGGGEGRLGTEMCCAPGAAEAGAAPSLRGGQASSRVLPSSVPLSHAGAAALGSDVSPRAGEAGEETAARGEPSGHGPRTREDRRTA